MSSTDDANMTRIVDLTRDGAVTRTIAELRAEVTILRTTIEGLHDEIRKRDARVAELRAEVEQLTRELAEARRMIEHLEDHMDGWGIPSAPPLPVRAVEERR